MRRNTVFTDVMHFFRANLEFDHETARSDDGGMQALVTVSLRDRNEIFETSRNWFIEFMNHA